MGTPMSEGVRDYARATDLIVSLDGDTRAEIAEYLKAERRRAAAIRPTVEPDIAQGVIPAALMVAFAVLCGVAAVLWAAGAFTPEVVR